MELERYEQEVPMTYYEKTLLRKWVMSGHSPREMPPSRYLCLTGSEPYDFLDIHRMDKKIRRDMKGMNKDGQKAYLMECMGWTDDESSTKDTELIESSEWDQDHPFGL